MEQTEKMCIRDWRRKIGYTSEKVASELLIERDTYTRKEKNHNFSKKQIAKVASVFGISPSQITD